ncbi:MAG: 7-cyano-7-deazaguanine synthase QueC [Verrucomicrobia bacterium]|nr:7-cyano-7-deazaguanine synthase QueC [Verrucomicrobiota bacterium]MBU1734761.1 7-cyano-7-deazaguanine synthase QueC [Verrucomicrobiota bacterium]MBU1857780.1 7-cyano-7-deazaguanine synthase QueC [Verrucomicrobiota bacterium]
MKSAVILLSGGLDSSTLLHYVKGKLDFQLLNALTIRYGQKHVREITCAVAQARAAGVEEHRQIDLTFFGELVAGASALTDPAVPVPALAELAPGQLDQPPTYVPNRNMLFLALAAAYAEAKGVADVFYGAQAQDRYGYWDCTVEFLNRMNAVLGLNRRQPIVLHAPFMMMRKREILKIGLDLGVNYAETWSCYRGQDKACGACPACVERRAAFDALHVTDPLSERMPDARRQTPDRRRRRKA